MPLTGMVSRGLAPQRSILAMARDLPGGAAWAGGSRAVRNIVVAGIAGFVGIWLLAAGCIGFVDYAARQQALSEAENTSILVSAYVAQTLKAGSVVIDSMRAMVADRGISTDEGLRAYLADIRVHQTLRERIANLPEIDKAAFIATDGRVLNFSLGYPAPPINVADRDYFREQMADTAPELSLSYVATDRGSGRQVFYLAKRITAPDGRLLGLAIAGIDAEFVTKFFRKTVLGAGVAIFLTRSDSVVLAGEGLAAAAYGEFFNDLPRGGTGGRARFVRGEPQVPLAFGVDSHVIATQPVEGLPAFLSVLIGDGEVFKGWWRWVGTILGVAVALSACLFVAVRRIVALIGELARAGVAGDAASEAGGIVPEVSDVVEADARRLRILAVDDSRANQLVLKHLLARDGHELDLASDGREAVEAARTNRYDVILMDVQMPVMDGVEATRQIRALPAPHGAVPVVMVTAHGLTGDRERYLAIGARDYVAKPVKMDALRGAIARVVAPSARPSEA